MHSLTLLYSMKSVNYLGFSITNLINKYAKVCLLARILKQIYKACCLQGRKFLAIGYVFSLLCFLLHICLNHMWWWIWCQKIDVLPVLGHLCSALNQFVILQLTDNPLLFCFYLSYSEKMLQIKGFPNPTPCDIPCACPQAERVILNHYRSMYGYIDTLEHLHMAHNISKWHPTAPNSIMPLQMA